MHSLLTVHAKSKLDTLSKITNWVNVKNKQHHSKVLLDHQLSDTSFRGIKCLKIVYHSRFHRGSQRVIVNS